MRRVLQPGRGRRSGYQSYWSLLALVVLTLVTAVGCAASSSTARTESPATSPHAGSGGSANEDAGSAEVPRARAKNAPAFCAQLASDGDIRGLSESVPRLIIGTSSGADRERVERAAQNLRSIATAADAESRAKLARRLNDAAHSIESLAGAEQASPQQAEMVSKAFARLDTEVQKACDFPLT